MSVVPLSRLATVTKTMPFAITGYETGPPRSRAQVRVSGGTKVSPLACPLWAGSAWNPGKSAARAAAGAIATTVATIVTARRDAAPNRMALRRKYPPGADSSPHAGYQAAGSRRVRLVGRAQFAPQRSLLVGDPVHNGRQGDQYGRRHAEVAVEANAQAQVEDEQPGVARVPHAGVRARVDPCLIRVDRYLDPEKSAQRPYGPGAQPEAGPHDGDASHGW